MQILDGAFSHVEKKKVIYVSLPWLSKLSKRRGKREWCLHPTLTVQRCAQSLATGQEVNVTILALLLWSPPPQLSDTSSAQSEVDVLYDAALSATFPICWFSVYLYICDMLMNISVTCLMTVNYKGNVAVSFVLSPPCDAVDTCQNNAFLHGCRAFYLSVRYFDIQLCRRELNAASFKLNRKWKTSYSIRLFHPDACFPSPRL